MDDREIPINDIRKCLNMSPNQFIDFLNKDEQHLATSYEQEYSIHEQNWLVGPFFMRKMLNNPDFTVHIQDWINFKETYPDLIKADMDDPQYLPNDTGLDELQYQLFQYDDFFANYPICREIFNRHAAGKSRAQIVRELTDPQGGSYMGTNSQVGFLCKPDTSAQSDDALKKWVSRLKKE